MWRVMLRRGAFLLFAILQYGVSADAVASVLIYRPAFTLHREPGTNTLSIKFESTLNGYPVDSAKVGEVNVYLSRLPASGGGVQRFIPVSHYSPSLLCDENSDGGTAETVQACKSAFLSDFAGKELSHTIWPKDEGGCIYAGHQKYYQNSERATVWAAANGNVCTYAPPAECIGDECDVGEGETPEPALSCSVETGSVDLDFGSMTMGEAAGKSVSEGVAVKCNKDGAKITMSLKKGGDNISLNNGMTVKITAGGKALGSVLTGSKGINSFIVKGTLSGSETEGKFSGSGVLVTDYQ
ncbi:hypothetical protein YT14_002761 [Salmonella enterica subsp. enterica serovar Oslo]|nr:hypothetical protein [Salmonella enterica subsp. enterica serovar Oslo]